MYIDLDNKVTRLVVQEYVNKICCFLSEEELNFNLHKLIHTFDVADMAQHLIKITKPALSPTLQKQILNAAILHDIGRCYEFKNGKKINIDHGKVGSDLIKQHFPRMKVEIQTTLLHNKLPSDSDPKFCRVVLDYVRDADMLGNLKYEIENTDLFFKHIFMNKDKNFFKPEIDQEIFDSIREARPAFTGQIKVHTLLTMWLWQMCWCYNLRTKAGKDLARKDRIFIRFKDLTFNKIIPLTTQDKKLQKSLVQMVQKAFPDKILFEFHSKV